MPSLTGASDELGPQEPPPCTPLTVPWRRCMSWGPDGAGVNGVYLGKNVVKCAGGAIEDVMRQVRIKMRLWQQSRRGFA